MTTKTMIKGLVHFVFAVYLVSLPSSIQLPVDGRVFLLKKPNPENVFVTARWLVAQNSWGVLKFQWSAVVGIRMGTSVGSPSNRSEQTMATPVSDNSFLRLNHPNIPDDDAGSNSCLECRASKPTDYSAEKSDHAEVKETLRLFNKHYLYFVKKKKE
ncbi:hypothetical protein TB2_029286 [Malus domestica]